MFIRTEHNYDRNAASDEAGLRCDDISLTKQSFKDECDINVIVARFNLTGQLPVGIRMPSYGDYADVFDFQSAMNAIAQANEAFDAMPAHVRARFQNDPDQFVRFCSDPGNKAEAEKMGLVMPKAAALAADAPQPAPTPAPAIPTAAPEAAKPVATL